MKTPIQKLPPEPFIGAGVYALYYIGSFPPYGKLSAVNRNNRFKCPIYGNYSGLQELTAKRVKMFSRFSNTFWPCF
ncbi:MAG: Eco29kI family restriction endonuclease [Saezia sp.]